MKFSPAKGTVKVSLTTEKDRAVLTITDQGLGIPPKDMGKVFDRFYRSANARAVSGTGLGLPITKEIVDKHGGTIELGSVPGGGTEVKISLPL